MTHPKDLNAFSGVELVCYVTHWGAGKRFATGYRTISMAKKISRHKMHSKEGFTCEDFKAHSFHSVSWESLFTEGLEKMKLM